MGEQNRGNRGNSMKLSTEQKILEQFKDAELALIKERAKFWAKATFYAKEGDRSSFIKQIEGDLNEPEIRAALDSGHSVVIDRLERGCVVPDRQYVQIWHILQT